jgi:hypothetical protein
MKKLLVIVFPVLLLGASACATKALHESFGMRYNAMFNTQASTDRPTRDATAMRGEEVQRVMQRYYQSIEPSEGGAQSQQQSSGIAIPRPTTQSGSGGVTLRAR